MRSDVNSVPILYRRPTQPQCHPAVTAWAISNTTDWHPETVLGNAALCRILHHKNTSALESAVQTGCISFRKQNTGLSSLQSKFFLFFFFFLTERGASHFFPITGEILLGQPCLSQCPYALNGVWVQGLCRQQTHVIPSSGHEVRKRLCEWLEGKTHGYHVTGKNRHLFIYFLPSVTNSKNRPLLGSHNSREQDKFFKILIGRQLT